MKIGVLGLGSIGLRHAKNLIALGHQVFGYDPDIIRSQMLVNAGGNGCSRNEAMHDVNGIVIASPTPNHLKDIHDSYNLNSIGVFVEKPIANKMDADIDWVDMVGFNLRWHSCVKQAKEWLDGKMIGQPLWGNFCVAQFNLKYAESVILNWSHEIDLALYLLGPGTVAACNARFNQLGAFEDLADIIFIHENACHSTIHLDYLTQPEIRQSIIVGSEASIIMDLVNRHAWLKGADGTIWDHLEGQDSWDENYVEEMEAFIDRLDGKETLGCTGQEGLEVLKVCLDAKKLAAN